MKICPTCNFVMIESRMREQDARCSNVSHPNPVGPCPHCGSEGPFEGASLGRENPYVRCLRCRRSWQPSVESR